ncbi:G patch domain and ankyrin repeat-containing protein 1 [Taeniopygia guttata]|uniref:G patch domain and ankyrin repeat-containing protein 1 n=1 Tax=Taeniopygia guttata TaxID=59729 RepID=UPI003BB8A2A9
MRGRRSLPSNPTPFSEPTNHRAPFACSALRGPISAALRRLFRLNSAPARVRANQSAPVRHVGDGAPVTISGVRLGPAGPSRCPPRCPPGALPVLCMALIAFRRAQEQNGGWNNGRLQREAPPVPETAAAVTGDDARSFYENLLSEGSTAEPSRDTPSSPGVPNFCRTCGISFRDPPAQHRRSTAHLLGLGAPPGAPPPYTGPGYRSPGYRLLLRAGWAGGGLGPRGNGRRFPVPTVLKKDRAGLGWGRPRRARVSHFGTGEAPVAPGGSRGTGGTGGRRRGRARGGSEEAEKVWEIRMREYMERWDPPGAPGELRDYRGPPWDPPKPP